MSEQNQPSAFTTIADVHRLTQDDFAKSVLPQLYHAIDRASLKSQVSHLSYFRLSLILLVLASTPALVRSCTSFFISKDNTEWLDNVTKFTALMSALFFAGTLIINFIIRLRQQDRTWYQARALAESIKSITWKFMTGAEPYGMGLSLEEAEQRLLADLRSVLAAAPKAALSMELDRHRQQQITDGMLIIRSADLENRCQTYLRFRLEDEGNWYARKASQNASAEQKLFNWVVICQLAALFLAMTRIAWPKTPFDAGPLLAAIATALLAWSQLKRYSEQATAYLMAAQELTFVAEQAKYVKTDKELAGYIGDAENAISREHMMWLARREVTNVQVAAKVG